MIRKRVDTEQGDLRVFANATEQAAIRADSAFCRRVGTERGLRCVIGACPSEQSYIRLLQSFRSGGLCWQAVRVPGQFLIVPVPVAVEDRG
jgi:hypothetical protein